MPAQRYHRWQGPSPLSKLNREGARTVHVNIGPNTAPATFDFAHNLWFAWDSPGSSTPTLPTTEAGGIYGQSPQLTGDGQIPDSSRAAGAGTAQIWLTGDRMVSCYGAPPSIGADEAR